MVSVDPIQPAFGRVFDTLARQTLSIAPGHHAVDTVGLKGIQQVGWAAVEIEVVIGKEEREAEMGEV